jgi:hypothetical protein
MGNQTSHSSFIPECGSAQPVWEPVACCTFVLEASLPSGTAVEPKHCCFVQGTTATDYSLLSSRYKFFVLVAKAQEQSFCGWFLRT